MTIDTWLQAALQDVDRRGLPELRPLLETLVQSTRALRAGDFNDRAGEPSPPSGRPASR